MTELEYLVDLHKENHRQGPGSREETLKALEFMELPRVGSLSIADIGCGTGAQTFILADKLQCHISAVDIFPNFLKRSQRTKKYTAFEHL